MKEFNLLAPIVDKAEQIGKHYRVLAFEGNPDEYAENDPWDPKRRNESNKHTKSSILIYNTETLALDWKSVYKNSKGVYFKKEGKNFYIN